MASKRTARHMAASTGRAQSGRLTSSIISNCELFALVTTTAAFMFAMLAIPTAMAILKQWGWW